MAGRGAADSIFQLLSKAPSATGHLRELTWYQLGSLLWAAPKLLRVIRPDDLLAIDFWLYNLDFNSSGTKLVRADPAKAAYLIAQFQGQSFGEQAYLDPNVGPAVAPPQRLAKARLSGPSRLSFVMPATADNVDYSLDAFLDACRTWPMSLDALAVPLPDKFSDDLPSKKWNVVTLADVGALSKSSIASVLQQSGLFEIEAGLAAALPKANADKISLAADRTARKVLQSSLRALREGRGGGEAIASLIDEQSEKVAAAIGLKKAADRQMVRALVGVAVAGKIAKAAAPAAEMSARDLFVIPGFLGILLGPHKPGLKSTWIEAPYRLYQSPIEPAGWWHALRPVKSGSRTELWHTRLAPKVDEKIDEKSQTPPMLRAIWSPDYNKTSNNPFVMALTPRQRSDIVRLTAGFGELAFKPDVTPPTAEPYVPKPTNARRVILSTLGSWLNSEGIWTRQPIGTDPHHPATVNVQAWRHLSAMARDYYVRVVEVGFLFPLGHAAALVTVTERRFEDIPNAGGRVADLRQFTFIVVREPVRTYPGLNQRFEARDFPFRRMEIVTKLTPILLQPVGTGLQALLDPPPVPPGDAFWPMFRSDAGIEQDVRFKIRATDISGREASFAMPLIFLKSSVNDVSSSTAKLISSYAKELARNAPAATEPRPVASLSGQLVELAPQVLDGKADGDTVFPVDTVTFAGATPESALAPNRAPFYPSVAQFSIVAPALKHVGKLSAPIAVEYPNTYKTGGFKSPLNVGQIFLATIEGSRPDLSFGGSAPNDSVGGLVAPNMTVGGFSRATGAVGGNADSFASGQFDPATFFPSAKLFGTIDLKDLILGATPIDLLGASTPKLRKVEFPDRIEISFEFRRDTISDSQLLLANAGGTSVLDITAKTIAHLDVGSGGDPGLTKPEMIVDASLTNFKLNLFGCIILWFDKLHFKVMAGEKPDVDPKLHADHPVLFGGPLEFVNGLSEILPSNGFSDPPMLTVSPSGLMVGYSLGLPTLAVGIFSLQNMSIGAQLRLPFDGDPVSVRFNFCERQKPFLLTVSLFGGGGFFAISLDNSGVREVEAAFEFGAFAAINLGVASGSVYVKAGIYYHWGDKVVVLEGYFEMGGEMSVIGLISVSLKFHLSLGYYKSGGMSEVKGQASLVVEIEILFFSTSVTVTVERRLGGSEADPRFVDFVPDRATWDAYAGAFA